MGILAQLKTIPNLPIYYWTNERSQAEIDYLVQYEGNVIPIEVKAATNLKAKSLNNFIKENQSKISVKTSLADYKLNDNGLYVTL